MEATDPVRGRKIALLACMAATVLICGPTIMVTKLEEELARAGVPSGQIHHELFNY